MHRNKKIGQNLRVASIRHKHMPRAARVPFLKLEVRPKFSVVYSIEKEKKVLDVLPFWNAVQYSKHRT
jgi:hypothetical protein